MKVAIIVFPEMNSDIDLFKACETAGWYPEYVYYSQNSLDSFELVILPGFNSCSENDSHIQQAVYSPIITEVKSFNLQKKGVILGISSGFKILCEIGLLPGDVVPNENGKFICTDSDLTLYEYGVARKVVLPIAHSVGKFVVNPKILNYLEENNMVFLQYVRTPNGSVGDIAGLIDREKGVVGMIPHPEIFASGVNGHEDGKLILKIIENLVDEVKSRV